MPRWNPFSTRKRVRIAASAGSAVDGSGPPTSAALIRRAEKWQENVLHLSSAVPESAGASALIENTMRKLVLRVEGIENDSLRKKLEDYLETFPLGRAGQLIWLVGEVFPSWTIEGNQISWDAYSPEEFKVEQGKEAKLRDIKGKFEPVPANQKWYRNWKPDPGDRYAAWSTHKSMVDLLESMYLHQLADTAVATSRLAGAGILYWPTSLPSLPLIDGRPEEGSMEELQQRLEMAMTDSIKNRNGADAIVPIIAFADPSLGDGGKPEHILMERPDDAAAFASRMASYRLRYATGTELPIEDVTGLGPANHWTAWVIKEDKWRFYIAPLADVLTEGLTNEFLLPLLRGMNYTGDLSDVKVVADGTELITKPDKSEKALRLAELGGYLNKEAVLRETGFDPELDAADGSEPDSNRTVARPMPAEARDTTPT